VKRLLPRRSLSLRLRAVVLLSTILALVVALGAMIAYDLVAYRRGWISDLRVQAELLGTSLAPALATDDPRTARERLGPVRVHPRIREAAIFDARGTLITSWRAQGAQTLLPDQPAPDGVVASDRDLVVWHRVVDHGRTLGTVYLRARDELTDRILNYSALALAVGLLALMATWVVSSWLQGLVTQPVLSIAAIARDVVETQDYSRRAVKLSDDEVGGLVDAFNAMLSEIERRTHALEASNREKDREVEERRRAQQEVERLNAELEQRVRERTAQLEASNRELSVASEAAAAANRAKSEFLSNMSHELRTPLNAIIGFGQLLTSDDMRATPERSRTFLNHILDAGRHLLLLINEILNLSQIEAGKLTLSVEPVALDEVLEECAALTQMAASQRGIRLAFGKAGGLYVNADRMRLKQVLLNLLSNAVKYNRRDGAVIVESAADDEGFVRISVQDTGPGLEPEQQRGLFQPFNRLGRETDGIEGSGIGLALTKRLVELMGGKIGVHSTPGAGSVFWVQLRAATMDAGQSAFASLDVPAPAAPPAVARPATVLCIDDNLANLTLLKEALALRADCRVLTATDGRAGVEVARRYQPDVILMDNNMPVMGGMEALDRLRADPSTAAIPVIAVSAGTMADALGAGTPPGFFRCLVKPFDLVDLMDAVDAALDEKRKQPRRAPA
jgi:signal transduction histidine kinase/ActR/RegA family two-component response regulator